VCGVVAAGKLNRGGGGGGNTVIQMTVGYFVLPQPFTTLPFPNFFTCILFSCIYCGTVCRKRNPKSKYLPGFNVHDCMCA